jgi:hypothetical protein
MRQAAYYCVRCTAARSSVGLSVTVSHPTVGKSSSDPVVYFIQAESGGPIKIGRAKSVKRRLAILQIGNPARLVVLRTTPGGAHEEAALHAHFAASRLSGEWFEPTEELLALIAAEKIDLFALAPLWYGRYDRSGDDCCAVCDINLGLDYGSFPVEQWPDQCRACLEAAPYRETAEEWEQRRY